MTALPTHHKSAVWIRDTSPSKHHFEIQTSPIPIPGPLDVLVNITHTGVCGSDISLASGHLGPCTQILGHEGVGRIVALGSSVPPNTPNTAIGTRVGVAWQRDICGACDFCLRPGGETRCLASQTGRNVPGTFAEYTVVPYRYITPVGEEVQDEMVCPILCGGVTIYKGLKICGATPGEWVVISGAGGGVGALGVQYAKAMGYRVIAVDAGKEKEVYCLELGAEAYIDVAGGGNAVYLVKEKSDGIGAAAVLVTAGSCRSYQDAISMLGPFGTLVCIGIPPPDQTVTFHPLSFIDRGIKIIGSAVGTRLDIREALTFVERKLVTPTVHVTKLEDLSEIGNLITSGKVDAFEFLATSSPGTPGL